MASEEKTLAVLGKLMAQDTKVSKARQKSAEKGGSMYCGPIGEGGKDIRIREADAGGYILNWYGPNGSRDVVVKTVDEIPALLKKFFSGSPDSDSDEG